MGLTINVGDLNVPTLRQFALQAASDFGLLVRGQSEVTLHLQSKDQSTLTTIKIIKSGIKSELVLLTKLATDLDIVALWRLLEAYDRVLELAGRDVRIDVLNEDD